MVGPQGREKKRRDSETTTRARDGSPTRDAASKSSRGWRRARAKASERERKKNKEAFFLFTVRVDIIR